MAVGDSFSDVQRAILAEDTMRQRGGENVRRGLMAAILARQQQAEAKKERAFEIAKEIAEARRRAAMDDLTRRDTESLIEDRRADQDIARQREQRMREEMALNAAIEQAKLNQQEGAGAVSPTRLAMIQQERNRELKEFKDRQGRARAANQMYPIALKAWATGMAEEERLPRIKALNQQIEEARELAKQRRQGLNLPRPPAVVRKTRFLSPAGYLWSRLGRHGTEGDINEARDEAIAELEARKQGIVRDPVTGLPEDLRQEGLANFMLRIPDDQIVWNPETKQFEPIDPRVTEIPGAAPTVPRGIGGVLGPPSPRQAARQPALPAMSEDEVMAAARQYYQQTGDYDGMVRMLRNAAFASQSRFE